MSEHVLVDRSEQKQLKILVAGGSGFIGRRLVERLSRTNHEVLCMTRNPKSMEGRFASKARIVKADILNYQELLQSMQGVDVAYYLVHSMEGSSRDWHSFVERERVSAENFAKAASDAGVKRIIYLGGLSNAPDEELSLHMQSRKRVGEILQTSSAKVTIFRAAVILGDGGGSFEMLRFLVERLPLMVCPKWVLTKSQPVAVDDVITYLAKTIDIQETQSRTFDIGGPEILTYVDMMKRYGKMIGRTPRILIIPFLTPRLSSYWVDMITPVKTSLARPLVDSLKHEATVHDDSIKKIIPMDLKTFEQAIGQARIERASAPAAKENGRTSIRINNFLLVASLLTMAALGSMYYWADGRQEVMQPHWLATGFFWYLAIAVAVYFIRYQTRLGALIGGVVSWITLAFWLADDYYILSGNSLLTQSVPDITMTTRNVVGALVATSAIVTSHNFFHKLHAKG